MSINNEKTPLKKELHLITEYTCRGCFKESYFIKTKSVVKTGYFLCYYSTEKIQLIFKCVACKKERVLGEHSKSPLGVSSWAITDDGKKIVSPDFFDKFCNKK